MKFPLICMTVLGLFAASLSQAQPVPAPKATYILAGHVIDKPGEPVRGPTTIILRGDRIVELRDGFVSPPAGATVIDLKDKYVLPGLIDAHVHLWGIAGEPAPGSKERLLRVAGDRIADRHLVQLP